VTIAFKHIYWILGFIILSSVSIPSIAKDTRSTPLQIPQGKSQFVFDYSASKKLDVWVYRPEKIESSTQVLFIMHGVKRDAERYLDEWLPYLKLHKMVGIVPHFSQQQYPKSLSYNLGNMHDKLKRPRKREDWSFSVVEPLFDKVRSNLSLDQQKYNIYGHSAGAQFVHRFLMLNPQARINKAISANAGWYTLPLLDEEYPYGLRGTNLDTSALKQAFSKKLIVLLGTEDSDPKAKYLRKTKNALKQGDNRLDRGIFFYNQSKIQSANISANLNWQINFAQGVGHSNKQMAAFAVDVLVN